MYSLEIPKDSTGTKKQPDNDTFRAIWDHFMPFWSTQKFWKPELNAYPSHLYKNYIVESIF